MNLDVRLLEPFLAVCDAMSFTLAAERLSVSQPRLSLLINKLEQQLGFRVFLRAHRRIELTREGLLLHAKALAIRADLQALDDLISELRGETRTRVRIGGPRYILEIPERVNLVEAFTSSRPSARIEMTEGRTAPLLQRLRAGELDLVFATSPFDDAGLKAIPFAESDVFMAIPVENELSQYASVPIEAVAGHKLAVYPNIIGRSYFTAWFGPFADAGAQLVEGLDDHPPSLQIFAAGRRLLNIAHAWGGRQLVLDDSDRMVLRPIEGADRLRIRVMLVRAVGGLSPAAEAFWDMAERATKRRTG
jgi:DNA-binding transcriptional LysR family regulator